MSDVHNERIPLRRAEPEADDGARLEYQRPIYGGSLKGAFRLPHSAIVALGDGDPEAGLAVADQLFGYHTALGRGVVHPDVVRLIGEGDMKAGRRVLAGFVKKAHHAHQHGSE